MSVGDNEKMFKFDLMPGAEPWYFEDWAMVWTVLKLEFELLRLLLTNTVYQLKMICEIRVVLYFSNDHVIHTFPLIPHKKLCPIHKRRGLFVLTVFSHAQNVSADAAALMA